MKRLIVLRHARYTSIPETITPEYVPLLVRLGEYIAKRFGDFVAVASPAPRARQTAQTVAASAGMEFWDIEMEVLGEYDYTAIPEALEQLRRAANAHDVETVVAVTHGPRTRAMGAYFLGQDPQYVSGRDLFYAEAYIIDFEAATVKKLCPTAHPAFV